MVLGSVLLNVIHSNTFQTIVRLLLTIVSIKGKYNLTLLSGYLATLDSPGRLADGVIRRTGM